ncbi:MAG: thioredoxin domain-containing protein [Patescibacteria group bacterium]|nr:thioredoxin domain-containing protein [Patescibacteria group bacterium]
MENEKKESSQELSSEKKGCSKKMDNKKIIFIAISAVVLILLGTLISRMSPNSDALSVEEAKLKAETFINDNLMMPGTKATITEAIEEYGLYKISVDVGSGEIIESYISKDGTLFFPQSINIQEYEEQNNPNIEASVVSQKNDQPEIELFVMSHCPYGTQMEKAIIPALEVLKDKVNFTLKFNTYAMHDKAELDEQLNQYCIQKEASNSLLTYLKCFNASEDSTKCLGEANIDKNTISSCVSATDKEYKITENYQDKTTWLSETYPIFPIFNADNEKYGVEGSPTLVINGETVTSDRTPDGLLKLICTAFNTAPEECQQELSTTAPGYGFGE